MNCNWIELPLGDLIELKRGYDLPKSKRCHGNIPIVSSAGISDFHADSKVQAPGVVTGRYGTIGEVFYVEENFWPLNTTLYVKDFKGNYPEFVYYLLKTFDFHKYSDKAAVPGVNRNHLHMEMVRVPSDYDCQKKIASYLSKLDKKISLNTDVNNTLEEIAQAIFKSWFVDFDPVKAKMNGEQPEGMDAATASLFPDKLVESESGLIPDGWEVLESQKVATVAIGKTPPRKEPQWFSENPSNVTWISIKDMGNAGTYALDSSEYLTPEAVDKFNVKVIPDNTLILSFKLTVGRVAITHGEMTTNEAIAHYKLADDARVSTNFLYSYMKQFNFESLGSTSSIAKAVNSKIIKALPVIVPSKEILDNFDTLVKPLFDKIKSNQMENQNLEALRDTLLPKLLSGEIELDVEKVNAND
ncbi:restriction endonuclease subunit S [Vibrio parahaemolyticus]|uniref:restriction endonuclease subunit S n=1 Tax=Vibrio parahaemolyticus TaxID=670 RepID=UPI001122FB9E|nr:restriction endonuclease subunit S [Vibrio parahaemolyticus]EHK2921413.1 restriction endonuclease subunit S [Vibrio parahaemolyticus]EHK7585764.1 restriction endonuclease subunit S [Vibrio parahaemolyticus]TOG26287.1 restriction endonuclease [Vibrio parahaemolyticus]